MGKIPGLMCLVGLLSVPTSIMVLSICLPDYLETYLSPYHAVNIFRAGTVRYLSICSAYLWIVRAQAVFVTCCHLPSSVVWHHLSPLPLHRVTQNIFQVALFCLCIFVLSSSSSTLNTTLFSSSPNS